MERTPLTYPKRDDMPKKIHSAGAALVGGALCLVLTACGGSTAQRVSAVVR